VAIALELVRIPAPVVAKTLPAASIIIAAVGGEEQDLYGSNFLAQTRGLILRRWTSSNKM
jgi:Zn-dependent M28 family amino/carboxypeptidase